MSTILDALKKVERERESPREQLRHAPEPPPTRRRVSTVTIVACALIGFAAGAGVALWRDAEIDESGAMLATEPANPAQDEAAAGVPAPAAGEALHAPEAMAAAPATESARRPGAGPVDEPPAPPGPIPAAPPGRAQAAVPAPAGDRRPEPTDDSALEPSPFAPEGKAALGGAPTSEPPAAGEASGDSDEARVAALPDERDVPLDPSDVAELPELEPDAELDASDLEIPPDEERAPPQTVLIDTGRSPPGSPRVTLSFLQWSSDPSRRFAFISVDGGPSQRVQEGDAAGGVNVAQITPTGVQLRHGDKLFVIRPRH